MTICSGLAIGGLIAATAKTPEKSSGFLAQAIVILLILNLAPIVLALVLWRNRANLSHPEVKQKIGSLYELHNSAKKYVSTYSIVFLVRRSFFVLVTFAMYNYPGLQIQIMMYSTLLYVAYISNMSFH